MGFIHDHSLYKDWLTMSESSDATSSTRSMYKPVTCLDAEDHKGQDITDNVCHYFGCIEFSQRKDFYDSLGRDEQGPINDELRRIVFLRQVLRQSDEDSDRALVAQVGHSLSEWRRRNKGTIASTSQTRQRQGKSFGNTNTHDPNVGRPKRNEYNYDPIKDLNAYIIQFDAEEGFTDTTQADDGVPLLKGKFPNQKVSVDWLLNSKTNLLKKINPNDVTKQSRVRYFHFPANNMKWVQDAMARYYGEQGTQYDTEYRKVKNRTEANTLLQRNFWLGQEQGRGSNLTHSRHLRPLCEPVSSDPDSIKGARAKNLVIYMPFLHWEKDRQRNNFSDLIDKTSSREQDRIRREERILWDERRKERRELHGSAGTPEVAESSHAHLFRRSPNHTLRTRATTTGSGSKPLAAVINGWLNRQPSALFGHIKTPYPRRDRNGRLITRDSLGQLLYDAFRLYETMNNYRDRKLIDGYLHHEPPMHTRRTLDQAYYWTLPNTRARDRDQVVYRGTSAHPDTLHHYRPDEATEERWTCRLDEQRAKRYENEQTTIEYAANKLRQLGSRGQSVLESVRSVERGLPTMEPTLNDPSQHQTDEYPCSHKECLSCREAIQKIPRIVMVDQLWMWILDDNTVISFFPKRYGVNRQDPSGVHKTIRQRLANVPKAQIRTAYDVALIIIDECSNLFFDRTKTDTRQPQVVDIFAEAIGNMAQRSTISFEHLWHWATELAKAPTNKSSWVDLSQLHVALLNITPEGKLQRETKDIIEELGIMLYIARKQKEVLKSFKRHGATMLDPDGRLKETEQDPLASPIQSPDPKQVDPISTQRVRWNWFKSNTDEVLQEHEDHLEELDGLQRSAEHVNKNLEHLLALKQQQASVLQAWQAIRHGEEAVKQGRAIMIFTVITIIFLPLAFMAAIFGMNNSAFKDDSMPLRTQLQLMFSISVGVIVFVIVAAFSNTIRSLIWSITHVCSNWFLVQTGLYGLWLEFPERVRPEKVVRWAQVTVQKKKEDVRQQVRRRKRRQQEAKRKTLEEQADNEFPQVTTMMRRAHTHNGSVASQGTQGLEGAGRASGVEMRDFRGG